ncbi:fibronectin type III domain-containing protein [Galbibacter mesophilus]|uniref:fibronectin type III domain-containing protein n=1 Tax=Galbibacter mesophilus TaxID=379069 RepID=UPI00191F8BC0|nr:hypothetical protein [Galbibacter mesophilus]MCM5664454.1 hypothetical protein [Galbibacter mesophilus]
MTFYSLNAQSTATNDSYGESAKVVVKGHAKKDKILLRWAVDNKLAWKYGLKYGYIIERTTLLRNGTPLSPPERIIISGDTIKPKPINEWETFVNDNDMAAVAAQAIYGETFEVGEEDTQNALMKVVLESEELDRRFGFSLYAIDQDFDVAVHAGFGYVDLDVKKNEKYVYNIRSAVPEDKLKIEPSGIFISPFDEEELPAPVDFFGYYYKDAFVLVWEYNALLSFYTSYNLEKSKDGVNFEKVNEVPITKLADTPSSGISFTDSITEYNKSYWYRIVGVSNFNEMGPPSKAVQLTAIKVLQSEPLFTSTDIISDNEVLLNWEFPEEEQWKLSKYELLRADKAIGPYKTVVDSIGPSTQSYKYSPLSDINYFKLKAFGRHQDFQLSPPAMVQPVDSVPPVKPLGVEGKIDTLGRVTLKWTKNEEMDLNGYNIYRANRSNQEFTKLNKDYLKNEIFSDSIDMNSFNQSVFYKITALDFRYNESVPSDILELKRPDRIPPTSPVFESYKIVEGVPILSWTNSSSEDVIGIAVYRREILTNGLNEWEKVYSRESDTISVFEDNTVKKGIQYNYTIIALDKNGLESKPSPQISLIIPRELQEEKIKGIYANVDRENKFIELTWRNSAENLIEIQLFRKTMGNTFMHYKKLPPDAKRFIDTNLTLNSTYGYALKGISADGSITKWVDIEVVY